MFKQILKQMFPVFDVKRIYLSWTKNLKICYFKIFLAWQYLANFHVIFKESRKCFLNICFNMNWDCERDFKWPKGGKSSRQESFSEQHYFHDLVCIAKINLQPLRLSGILTITNASCTTNRNSNRTARKSL